MKFDNSAILKINRQGDFILHVHEGNHCGILGDPTFPARYTVDVTCKVSLDERGFLFDQRTVKNFFDSLGPTKFSCERLVMDVTRKLLLKIHEENPECVVKHIKVEIEPFP